MQIDETKFKFLDAVRSLNKAHDGMTEEEIRLHALCLAECIKSQEELIKSVIRSNARLYLLVCQQHGAVGDIAIHIRQALNLHTVGRKREARVRLAEIASGMMATAAADTPPPFDLDQWKTTEEAWPDAFNPKGTRKW
jgi:hypothetical protein